MATTYTNFLSGATTDNPLLIGATSVNGTALSAMPAITAPDTCWLVLDPDGANGAPEIVQVTAHTASATVATIVRAQQSTTAREHPLSTVFRVAVTKSDLDELPFRKMTTTGDMLYASAANTATRLAIGATGTVLHGGTTPSYSAVVAADLATDAVETAKIKDVNVTTAKIADGAATYAKQTFTKTRLTKTGTLTTSYADVTGYTETDDTSGFYASGANAVIPSGEDGTYVVALEVSASATNLGSVQGLLYINGLPLTTASAASNPTPADLGLQTYVGYLAAADTVKVQALVNDGGDTGKNQTIKLTLVRIA